MRSPKIYSEVGIPETPCFGICPRSYEVTQILVKKQDFNGPFFKNSA